MGLAGASGAIAVRFLLLSGRHVALVSAFRPTRVHSIVPDLLIDLVEIATYVYCADKATGRGGDAQVGMGADWRRSFRFVIPVRNLTLRNPR